MKKILFGILTILGIGLSFCSAEFYPSSYVWAGFTTANSGQPVQNIFDFVNGNYNCFISRYQSSSYAVSFYDSGDNLIFNNVGNYGLYCPSVGDYFVSSLNSQLQIYPFSLSFGSSSSCPDQLIDVQYNNGNTSTITCDGINYISIDGLSTLTNSNVNYEYTPYMNIDYKDEDNQSLIESYDKSILYLSGSLFKKTYTGDNDWILTSQGNNSDNSFSGYLPTFDITGGIDEITESGNIFNNFAENSVKFTLSNVPSYIQYVVIIMLLLFVLGFIRKFKRR